MVTAGDYLAEDDVITPVGALEHEPPSSLDDGAEGGAVCGGDAGQTLGELPGGVELHAPGVAHPVGGFGRGELTAALVARQQVVPVGSGGGEVTSGDGLCELAERRCARRLMLRERPHILGGLPVGEHLMVAVKVAEDEPQGPAIKDGVVVGEHEVVSAVRIRDEDRAQQWLPGDVDSASQLGCGDFVDVHGPVGGSQVDVRQLKASPRKNHLTRPLQSLVDQRRTKGAVAAPHGCQGVGESLRVEGLLQAVDAEDVLDHVGFVAVVEDHSGLEGREVVDILDLGLHFDRPAGAEVGDQTGQVVAAQFGRREVAWGPFYSTRGHQIAAVLNDLRQCPPELVGKSVGRLGVDGSGLEEHAEMEAPRAHVDVECGPWPHPIPGVRGLTGGVEDDVGVSLGEVSQVVEGHVSGEARQPTRAQPVPQAVGWDGPQHLLGRNDCLARIGRARQDRRIDAREPTDSAIHRRHARPAVAAVPLQPDGELGLPGEPRHRQPEGRDEDVAHFTLVGCRGGPGKLLGDCRGELGLEVEEIGGLSIDGMRHRECNGARARVDGVPVGRFG